ncbi:hypothetical protein KI387_001712, partial [Taxus chinensis]
SWVLLLRVPHVAAGSGGAALAKLVSGVLSSFFLHVGCLDIRKWVLPSLSGDHKPRLFLAIACLCDVLRTDLRVRDELEHLLDDDEDMAEMYLTEKLMQQYPDGASSPSSIHVARGRMEHKSTHSDAEQQSGFEALSGTLNILSGDENSSTSSSTHSGTKGLDVEELEMLLEAYFIQIDGALNKLSA